MIKHIDLFSLDVFVLFYFLTCGTDRSSSCGFATFYDGRILMPFGIVAHTLFNAQKAASCDVVRVMGIVLFELTCFVSCCLSNIMHAIFVLRLIC